MKREVPAEQAPVHVAGKPCATVGKRGAKYGVRVNMSR